VSGDHILGDITPNIQSWADAGNPLQTYLRSLDKVSELDVAVVLPGHRRIFKNCRERIQELKDHHRNRADEVITILKTGRKNAFQVASEMTWDITWESWDRFPVSQKWFATGEAIAHLKYLREKEMVIGEMHEGKLIYSLNEKAIT
jgi:glyoxylase-like metal-dependent hydrolase (beta-lactamase superfamily II)